MFTSVPALIKKVWVPSLEKDSKVLFDFVEKIRFDTSKIVEVLAFLESKGRFSKCIQYCEK